ncbi:TRAP transporter small permease [Sinomicrobium weinanense]|uniref:TRAP transporter small permease n=1 Tax=Sinomicrobium weinanense TaxID=2842200 RepID=A0A926JPV1_9FLAO|nr:TRAP transporter small permease [Sinomicrobium weinanense]MBC9795166.1 TRAP transporter small permease [Sinomicrobium weinanense]MBU3121943.1 TRAP transporter small permease [Sinomicrobium weinanense]
MKKKLDRFLGGFLVMILAILVIAVLWQIFSRYVLNAPSSVTEEISRFLLIWVGILGAAYCSGQQDHLAIEILPPRLDVKNRQRLKIVINVLIMLFSILVFIIGGSWLVYLNHILGQSSAALHIPLSWVYMVIPLSGIVILMYKWIEIMNPKKFLI